VAFANSVAGDSFRIVKAVVGYLVCSAGWMVRTASSNSKGHGTKARLSIPNRAIGVKPVDNHRAKQSEEGNNGLEGGVKCHVGAARLEAWCGRCISWLRRGLLPTQRLCAIWLRSEGCSNPEDTIEFTRTLSDSLHFDAHVL
jgi:hypothetical protein